MTTLADISAHFTAATLDAIVRASGGLRHTGWRFGGGFRKGDSYISETYRLHIDGLHADGRTAFAVSAIVKSFPSNAARRKVFRSELNFANEINFYRHVLGALDSFQQRIGVPPEQRFDEVPRLLYAHCNGADDFIVLEDLRPLGYGTAQRQLGMDVEHARLCMRTLGKFHAATLALGAREPQTLDALLAADERPRELYFAAEWREWYAEFARRAALVARDAVRSEYAGTETERKALAFTEPDYYDRMCELTARRNRYSVFGHGDCWLPNFMLQYEEDAAPSSSSAAPPRPVRAKIIDFQLGRFGSPAFDIAMFVYSCTQQAMRERHYDELLREYHASASELLRHCGCVPEEVFPWSALVEEMRVFARHGVAMGMEALPMCAVPDEEVVDLDALVGGDLMLGDVFKIEPIVDAAGRKREADMFKHAVDQGYLD